MVRLLLLLLAFLLSTCPAYALKVNGVVGDAKVLGVVYPNKVDGVFAWVASGWTGIGHPNPTPGLEMLTNGTFDANITGWSLTAAGGTIDWASGIRFTEPGSSQSMYASQSVTTVTGATYLASLTSLSDTYASGATRMAVGTVQNGSGQLYSNAITPGTVTGTCQAGGTTSWFSGYYGGTAGKIAVHDNYSLKPLTFAETLALRDYGKQKGIGSLLTVPVYYQGGVIARYSDANNYLIAILDRLTGKVRLDMRSGGTLSNKIAATAVTYGDGKNLKIVFSAANTAQVWYGTAGSETQVGGNIDVSALAAGTKAGLFATNATVTCGAPVIQ